MTLDPAIRVHHVHDLLHPATQLSDLTWAHTLTLLRRRTGLDVLPQATPAHHDAQVLLFPPDSDPFGPLLKAASRLAATRTEQAAHDTAQAARTVKSLTTVPRLRFYRQPPPGPGASKDELFRHYIGAVGNGFLPILGVDLSAMPLRPGIRRTVLPAPVPADPDAWVVVWGDISAAGTVLGGVRAAYSEPDVGAQLLLNSLTLAAGALTPGPRDIEWG
jgi:hypothetical protein